MSAGLYLLNLEILVGTGAGVPAVLDSSQSNPGSALKAEQTDGRALIQGLRKAEHLWMYRICGWRRRET